MSIWLTTTDNPWNPFTNSDEWKEADEKLGYFTMSWVARITSTTPYMDEDEIQKRIDQSFLEIAELNPYGTYIIVTENDYDSEGKLKQETIEEYKK